MRNRHYDVVVLGADLAGTLCAALVAKRGFRVLVLGQGALPPTYSIGGFTFPRAPHTFLSAHSSIARRVLAELAMGQLFRRRACQMDPSFQLAMPEHRVDAVNDPVLLDRELAREFPSVRRAGVDLHKLVERVGSELEEVLGRDFIWPPSSFLERREFARATAHRVFDREGGGFDPFAEFPESHPIRRLVDAPAAFATHMDAAELSPLARLRLYQSWWQGSAKLDGGYSWLHNALIERIRTHSGDVRMDERAESIITKRNVATGVVLADTAEEIGAGFVIGGVDIAKVASMLPDRTMFAELFERFGEPRPRHLRYTLNIVAKDDAFPVGMGRDSFSIFDSAGAAHGENLLRLEASPPDGTGVRQLCVEALLPRRGVEEVDRYLDGVRERILGAVTELAPFFGDQIIAVDSPHDGRDLQHYAERKTIASNAPWTRGPSTMQRVHGFPVMGSLGVNALPVRSPVRNLLLCNRQVSPGLGEEGEFLAAGAAAEIITRSNKRKSLMLRGLFNRVEV